MLALSETCGAWLIKNRNTVDRKESSQLKTECRFLTAFPSCDLLGAEQSKKVHTDLTQGARAVGAVKVAATSGL